MSTDPSIASSSDAAVVAGIDGSDAALGAARWAADFAASHALPLTLLHVHSKFEWHFAGADTPDHPDRGPAGDRALAAAETAVRQAHPDVVVHTAAVGGAVASTLSNASQSARLLVVASGDDRALGSNAVRITHRAHCPLVVCRAPVAKRTGKPLPVVVGVDESEESARAVAAAFDIATKWHAPLMVVHMWEIDAAVGMGDLGGQGNMDWPLLEMLQNQQRQRMDELVAPLAHQYRNAHVTKVFQDTSPAKGLAELSAEAQLVVVGRHGRGKLADLLLGSVSQSLIHHAECPVLVVR